MLKEYKKQKREVGFKASQAISTRGETVDSLNKKVREANSASALSSFKLDILEIEMKTRDDIALVKRMSK